jgi:hypothetical protein
MHHVCITDPVSEKIQKLSIVVLSVVGIAVDTTTHTRQHWLSEKAQQGCLV